MFKAKINAGILKDMLAAVTILSQEARINVTPDGIGIKAIDQANVAMVTIDLNKSAFTEYEVSDCVIPVDISLLETKLEFAGKDDIVSMELDEEKHSLRLKYGRINQSVVLLDPAGIRKEPKVPHLDYVMHVTIKGDDLKVPIKAINQTSAYIQIGFRDSKLFMESVDEQDVTSIEFTKDELINLECTVIQLKSMYTLDYLSDIGKILYPLPSVELSLSEDFPITIKAEIASGNGYVKYLVAPRVESN